MRREHGYPTTSDHAPRPARRGCDSVALPAVPAQAQPRRPRNSRTRPGRFVANRLHATLAISVRMRFDVEHRFRANRKFLL